MTRTPLRPEELAADFGSWQKTADMVDQLIDLMLNLRQSGHPGGSRSKTQMMVALTLSGAMRWDVRRPEKAWADRFVLVAGHCTPLVYALLAVYNEALRRMHARTGDPRYLVPGGRERQLVWEDLLNLRHHGGLSGHAEMEGKTLFFKANTGPSGHGAAPAAGIALALKAAGAEEVRVFALEGEGGHTAGIHHEVKHTAYGLGLGNLHYLLDWNDYGIDPRPFSAVVHGGPKEWFESYGFHVAGAEDGADFGQLVAALAESCSHEDDRPRCTWFRTIKGRGYIVTGNKSHGAAHKPNSENFWLTKKEFADKYGVEFEGFGQGPPETAEAFREQTARNMQVALSLLDDEKFCAWLADRLVELGDSVPDSMPDVRVVSGKDPARDPELTDPQRLPAEVFFPAGDRKPNRAGFARVAAYLNDVGRRRYGRPVVIAASADLAESTNIAGFAQGFAGGDGFGWYDRKQNPGGALLPTGITEFANAGILCGLATTNMSDRPEEEFAGFWGACSTYGSFSYLKYGMFRLFSQLAQDCQLKVGKVIWVAGHSGPETAEDSRTHFGIFAPGVTQLFPKGQVIDLHPWEPNDVGPCLLAALGQEVPIVALHLTRPPVEIPDREALGMDPAAWAARGAYLIRDYDPDRPRQGCIFVRGTSSTASVVELLRAGAFDGDGPNVKLVSAVSHELFLLQPEDYRRRIADEADWFDSTVITNGARRLMGDWIAHRTALDYALGSDWDDRWRTGGSGEEVTAEARLDPDSVLAGIRRFVDEREERLRRARGPESLFAQTTA
ncbi:MAG: transketolase [Planctomycetota bacterium]|nr:MAG: transketolase [Planctomycetota bacterium]